jgi:CMP-N-acetylneuraminic acid synthetase
VAAQPLDRAFRDNGNLYLTAAEQYQMSRELNRLPAEVKDEESKGDDE